MYSIFYILTIASSILCHASAERLALDGPAPVSGIMARVPLLFSRATYVICLGMTLNISSPKSTQLSLTILDGNYCVNSVCCGDLNCMPIDGQCCSNGQYCFAGETCGDKNGVPVCFGTDNTEHVPTTAAATTAPPAAATSVAAPVAPTTAAPVAPTTVAPVVPTAAAPAPASIVTVKSAATENLRVLSFFSFGAVLAGIAVAWL